MQRWMQNLESQMLQLKSNRKYQEYEYIKMLPTYQALVFVIKELVILPKCSIVEYAEKRNIQNKAILYLFCKEMEKSVNDINSSFIFSDDKEKIASDIRKVLINFLSFQDSIGNNMEVLNNDET